MAIAINEELAEEIGWHIGDGSMNYYGHQGQRGFYQLRGHIEDDREHYLTRIKPIFERVYGVKINLRDMPSTRVFGFQIWRNSIIQFKQTLGLPLGKKYELEIPKEFCNDPILLKACIRGLFDTDGCLYLLKKNNKLYPIIQITTISKKLGEQLHYQLRELEFRATIHSQLYNQDYNRQRVYIVVIRGVEMLHKFFSEIQPKNQKHINKYYRFLASAKT